MNEEIEKTEEVVQETETTETVVQEQTTADVESEVVTETEAEIKTETKTEIEVESEPVAETPKIKEKIKVKTDKLKKLKNPKALRISFADSYDKLQSNIPVLFFTCFFALVVMMLFAVSIFFANVKGAEKVLVPNVIGKKLEDALLEMQVKELYPKINLRYSDKPGDEGTILDQSPEAGAIVKGYSRVSLVVSRGVIVDKIEDYVGMNLDDLQLKLSTLFAGQTKPLIVLGEPEYKPDTAPAGTILEQNPPAGTNISEPVTVQLVISRGPQYENTKAPRLIGQSVNDLLQTIARSKLVFDITSHIAEDNETAGTVVGQDSFDSEYIPIYSRVNLEMALPAGDVNDNVYGIFTEQLSVYPFPVSMRLEAQPSEGDSFTVLSFVHPGGNLTIPYAVPHGTTLVLYVSDKPISKKNVN